MADVEQDGSSWLSPPEEAATLGPPSSLLERAQRLDQRLRLEPTLRKVLGSFGLLWFGAAGLGLLAGLSAAWAGLAGGGDPTRPEGTQLNPLWFLQITLGVHTVFLLAALILPLLARAGLAHPWAGAARAVASGLIRLGAHGRPRPTGMAAVSVALGGRRGLWLASALGHTAGLSFIVGSIAALVVAAGFREQYRFFWKSTLLTDSQVVALVDAVASGPRALGLPTPTRAEIVAARAGADRPADDLAEPSRWAWMLVGSLVVWGACPRLIALACVGTALRHATRAGPLPVSESYAERAMARDRRLAADAGEPMAPAPDPIATRAPGAPDHRPRGPAAVLGYEIDREISWPPAGLEGCVDLGIVDGAADRRRVLEHLDDSPTQPAALIVCFSRGETPAAAERDFVVELVARIGDGMGAVLTLSRALATDRSDRDAERIAHRTGLWREMAVAAGIPAARVIEADLLHSTAVTAARLAVLAGDRAVAPSSAPGAVRAALDDIDRWAGADDFSDASLAALLRHIENRFDATPRWRRAVESARSIEGLGEAKAVLAESAKSFGKLLPGWMPRHVGWASAAATLVTTGTLSAVALAGGPIGWAAGAWPLYAAVGAALGELGGRGFAAARREPPQGEGAAVDGVRAAVLHALVLGLQGMGDEQVARSIDFVLDGAPEIATPREAPRLTAHVRIRLGLLPESGGAPA
ncbi:MAG: DUF2868 domain-containing protein [Phycisphaerales bacterium]|nr:DUF2868 domain-containing protein [Phycisphaerales bacterium]